MEHLGKVSVLLGVLKGDEVHTPLATEVPGVEPVPVLELVPGLSPGEEVVVPAVLLVVFPVSTHFRPGFVQQRPPVRTQPGLLLGGDEQEEAVEQQDCQAGTWKGTGQHLHLHSATVSEGLGELGEPTTTNLAGGLPPPPLPPLPSITPLSH